MRLEPAYALLMGRLIDLLQRSPTAVEDHRAALRALVDLTRKRSATIRVERNSLTVEGKAVPTETPFVPLLMERMQAHRIAEIRIAHPASALDLILVLRAIALDPDTDEVGHSVERRIQEGNVTTVSVLTADLDEVTQQRRRDRVTAALEESGILPRRRKADRTGAPDIVSASTRARYDEMVRDMPSPSATLSGDIKGLSVQPAGPLLTNQLEKIQGSITEALRKNEAEQALEATVALIHLEEKAATDEARRLYSSTLRRLLYKEVLRQFAKHLLDELYTADVVMIVRRAGTAGTKVLLDLLVEAPTFAERKAYLSALRQIETGTDVVASMLSHHQWFVVRNVADLAGELRIEEALPALGEVAQHEDVRARRSVGIALAKIGTRQAVPFLRIFLHDPDPDVRAAVAREVGGRGVSALAMHLVTAAGSEKEQAVVAEYYRALGRIGTSDAVQALANAAQPGGRILHRRAVANRLAAVDGLALAGGDAARAALKRLTKDRSGKVRRAAQKALRGPLN